MGLGRDPERTPMQWDAQPNAGFHRRPSRGCPSPKITRGWRTDVTRLPDPDQPDKLASVRALGRIAMDPALVDRRATAERRYTDRRPFRTEAVPDRLVASLTAAGTGPGAYAAAVQRPAERLDLAVAFHWADAIETDDRAYRAELARWTRHEGEGALDGVPASAVPHAIPGSRRHTDAPVRDFEAGITGSESLRKASTNTPSTWSSSPPRTTRRRDCGPARLTCGFPWRRSGSA